MIELSRLTISDGVPFGKNIPYQLPISRPGTNVLIVGRSGKERFFSAVVTARQRTRPVLPAAAATGPVANSMSISPVISPVIDGPPPVKATINVSSPAICASISAGGGVALAGVLLGKSKQVLHRLGGHVGMDAQHVRCVRYQGGRHQVILGIEFERLG